MLIEVKRTKPLPQEVVVMEPSRRVFQQPVKFESKPEYCEECLKIGHNCATQRQRINAQKEAKQQDQPKKKQKHKKIDPYLATKN